MKLAIIDDEGVAHEVSDDPERYYHVPTFEELNEPDFDGADCDDLIFDVRAILDQLKKKKRG